MLHFVLSKFNTELGIFLVYKKRTRFVKQQFDEMSKKNVNKKRDESILGKISNAFNYFSILRSSETRP